MPGPNARAGGGTDTGPRRAQGAALIKTAARAHPNPNPNPNPDPDHPDHAPPPFLRYPLPAPHAQLATPLRWSHKRPRRSALLRHPPGNWLAALRLVTPQAWHQPIPEGPSAGVRQASAPRVALDPRRDAKVLQATLRVGKSRSGKCSIGRLTSLRASREERKGRRARKIRRGGGGEGGGKGGTRRDVALMHDKASRLRAERMAKTDRRRLTSWPPEGWRGWERCETYAGGNSRLSSAKKKNWRPSRV